MRVILLILALVMVLFVAVQYNDPDGPLWMAIYGVPAAFAIVGAVRPSLLAGGAMRALVALAALAAAGGVLYYWPAEADFWRQSVWWNSETAREGMGVMIVLVTLLIVLAAAVLGRREAR